jgi:hypothetical protein
MNWYYRFWIADHKPGRQRELIIMHSMPVVRPEGTDTRFIVTNLQGGRRVN